jgi:hypothetical protein
METPDEILFKTTSRISAADLTAQYGELGQADIVFLLAEHKNFEAAKAAFDTWGDMDVFDMQYYLTQAFPHQEWLLEPLDSYIAHAFVMKLVDERNNWARELPGQPLSAEVLVLRRLAGILPHIDIGGTDFTIDWRMRELRETADPWNRIGLDNMELSPSGDAYLSFYHTGRHQVYQLPDKLLALPEDVMLLEIPLKLLLDPIGTARANGLDDLALLRQCPIRQELHGKLVPLEETLLPQIIAQNLAGSERECHERHVGR